MIMMIANRKTMECLRGKEGFYLCTYFIVGRANSLVVGCTNYSANIISMT